MLYYNGTEVFCDWLYNWLIGNIIVINSVLVAISCGVGLNKNFLFNHGCFIFRQTLNLIYRKPKQVNVKYPIGITSSNYQAWFSWLSKWLTVKSCNCYCFTIYAELCNWLTTLTNYSRPSAVPKLRILQDCYPV